MKITIKKNKNADQYTHFLHTKKKCCAKTDETNYDTSDIE
jgi:hypothetical protein